MKKSLENIFHPNSNSNEKKNQKHDTKFGVEEIAIGNYNLNNGFVNVNNINIRNMQTPKDISLIKPHITSISPPKPNISPNLQYQFMPKNSQEYQPQRMTNPLPPEIPPSIPNHANFQTSQDQINDNIFFHPSVKIPKYYSFTYHGIEVKFPYEKPYEAQILLISNSILAFQNKQNALLESPTGTGKSLALLSAALSFLEACPTVNKIYYTSRTHIQLKQLVGELKKLPFFPQFSILASKRYLCIVPEVANSISPENECRKLCDEDGCPYNKSDLYNNKVFDIEDAPVTGSNPNSVPFEFTNRGSKPKFDLDDLKEYGLDHSICPYQLAFNIYQTSQLVFCPYNYLLKANDDKNILLAFPKDSTIAIFDEGHNIENIAREDASLTLSYKQVDDARKAAQFVPFNDCYYQLFQKLEKIQTDILNFIDRKRKEYDKKYQNTNKYKIPKYLCAKSLKYVLKDIQLVSSVGIQMANWLKILSNSNKNDRQNMYVNDIIISFFSTCADAFLALSTSTIDFYRIVFVPDERGNKNKDEFRLLCLKPSFLFDKINRKARSIIISSGTLSPLESFASELEASFPIRVSAPHVVDSSQVLTISINSHQNCKITSQFNHLQLNGDKVYQALGDILIMTLKTVPGGSLFFTPSYYIKNSILTEWKSSNKFDEISSIKPIVEEQSNLSADAIINEYTSFSNGALLIGVCRGKVSEGLDFSDDLSRIVYAFGIPYPNIKDANVELKMKYNDLRHGTNILYLSGDEWYNCQAFRALFQSVGRCLRHASDYGAIVFLDNRIDSNINKLPNWMKTNFHQALDVNQAERLLSSFYAEMKKRYPSKNSMGSSLLSFQAQLNSMDLDTSYNNGNDNGNNTINQPFTSFNLNRNNNQKLNNITPEEQLLPTIALREPPINTLYSNTSPTRNKNINSYCLENQQFSSFNLNKNNDQKLNDIKSEISLLSTEALRAKLFNLILQGKDPFNVKPEKLSVSQTTLKSTQNSFELNNIEKTNREDIISENSFDNVCITYENPNSNNNNYTNINNYNNNHSNNYNNECNDNNGILIQSEIILEKNDKQQNIFLTDMFCKICGSLIIQIKNIDFIDSKMIKIQEFFEILEMNVNKVEVMYLKENQVETDLTKSSIRIICENDSIQLERRVCPRCGCPIAAYVVRANKKSPFKKGELLFRQDMLAMKVEGKIQSLVEFATKCSE